MRVGAWADLRPGRAGRTLDLGEVALLPGLMNAHCHLDYTHMAGLFPPPAKSFCDWIKCITTEKAQWQASDYLKSWLAGAAMLVRNGTTTVGMWKWCRNCWRGPGGARPCESSPSWK